MWMAMRRRGAEVILSVMLGGVIIASMALVDSIATELGRREAQQLERSVARLAHEAERARRLLDRRIRQREEERQ